MMRENTLAITRRTLLAAAVLGPVIAPGALMAQAAKPKIGFIGAGRMGGTLAKFWAQAGYQVMLSARDLGPVKEVAAQIGSNAQVGTPEQAAAWGDVIVVTVPYGALPQVGRDYATQLKGKIVLDTCNPNPTRDGDMTKDALEKGTGVMDAIYLPGTRLVRAFNAISFAALASNAHHPGELIGIELAADDPQALSVAKQLVTDAGYEPVVVGNLSTAKKFDTGTPVYPKAIPASQLRAMLGVK
jgi:predicted dinucleotide-binding enzyme